MTIFGIFGSSLGILVYVVMFLVIYIIGLTCFLVVGCKQNGICCGVKVSSPVLMLCFESVNDHFFDILNDWVDVDRPIVITAPKLQHVRISRKRVALCLGFSVNPLLADVAGKGLANKIEPDEIYNLAAQSHVAVSFEVPEYTANADALGALRILEAIRILNFQKKTKFYQAGTSEMYGKVQSSPQNEKTSFFYFTYSHYLHFDRMQD